MLGSEWSRLAAATAVLLCRRHRRRRRCPFSKDASSPLGAGDVFSGSTRGAGRGQPPTASESAWVSAGHPVGISLVAAPSSSGWSSSGRDGQGAPLGAEEGFATAYRLFCKPQEGLGGYEKLSLCTPPSHWLKRE